MVDRVRALVLESPSSGGTQVDYNPVEVDPKEDGLDARAFFAQNGTSADAAAYVSRMGANLTLTDPTAGTKNAADLVSRVSGSVAAHNTLLDMAHFVGAPADGWATPYLTVSYTGPLMTSRTWWTSSAQTRPIFRQTFTYAGALIAQIVHVIFDANGATAKTLTDVYSYTGPILAGIARSAS